MHGCKIKNSAALLGCVALINGRNDIKSQTNLGRKMRFSQWRRADLGPGNCSVLGTVVNVSSSPKLEVLCTDSFQCKLWVQHELRCLHAVLQPAGLFLFPVVLYMCCFFVFLTSVQTQQFSERVMEVFFMSPFQKVGENSSVHLLLHCISQKSLIVL